MASKYSYDYQTDALRKYKHNTINVEDIAIWNKSNLYRTNYVSQYSIEPRENLNVAIPKY